MTIFGYKTIQPTPLMLRPKNKLQQYYYPYLIANETSVKIQYFETHVCNGLWENRERIEKKTRKQRKKISMAEQDN